MLVLTRKCQEKIQIGENITITIVRVKGQSVRVGIDAPREMKVLRTELPPERPEDGTGEAQAKTANAASSGHNTLAQPSSTEATDEEADCRANYRSAKQPLAQYVAGTRTLAVTCAG